MSKVVLSDFPFPGDHLLVAAQAVMEVTLFCLVDVHRTVGLHVGHWVLDCSGGWSSPALGLDVLGLPVFVVPSWCKFRFGGAASIPPPIVSPRRFPLPVPRRRFGATHVVHGE